MLDRSAAAAANRNECPNGCCISSQCDRVIDCCEDEECNKADQCHEPCSAMFPTCATFPNEPSRESTREPQQTVAAEINPHAHYMAATEFQLFNRPLHQQQSIPSTPPPEPGYSFIQQECANLSTTPNATHASNSWTLTPPESGDEILQMLFQGLGQADHFQNQVESSAPPDSGNEFMHLFLQGQGQAIAPHSQAQVDGHAQSDISNEDVHTSFSEQELDTASDSQNQAESRTPPNSLGGTTQRSISQGEMGFASGYQSIGSSLVTPDPSDKTLRPPSLQENSVSTSDSRIGYPLPPELSGEAPRPATSLGGYGLAPGSQSPMSDLIPQANNQPTPSPKLRAGEKSKVKGRSKPSLKQAKKSAGARTRKVYHCRYPWLLTKERKNCLYTAYDASNRKKHEQTHWETKAYACYYHPQCNTRMARSDDIKRHLESGGCIVHKSLFKDDFSARGRYPLPHDWESHRTSAMRTAKAQEDQVYAKCLEDWMRAGNARPENITEEPLK